MTVVRSDNNFLFGGYTSVAWTSDGTVKNDTNAFLFTLTNPHGILPTKYKINPANAAHAVYHHSSYGPMFGDDQALWLFTDSNEVNSNCTNFSTSYIDTTGEGDNTFTGAPNFIADDIEVFKLA